MTTKRCFKCGCEKPLEGFYKHAVMADKHLNKCKECTKEDVRRHRQENLERVRAYDKLRGAAPHRVAARKEYAQTEAGKHAHRRALRASKLKFPEKAVARYAVSNAIRDGRLTPWPVCAVPECDRKPHGHHADYARPLDVVWLCPTHHKQAHAIVANEPELEAA